MENLLEATRNRIENALKISSDTRHVVINRGILNQTGELFRKAFGGKSAVLVTDLNLYELYGKSLWEMLRAEGKTRLEEPIIFPERTMHAEMKHIDFLKTRLAAIEAVPVAFGSGTVNDLTKYSSSLCDRPYMVVGTAASMDGYTSFGASIEYQSYKQTFSCPAPYAVLIDLEIIEKAPLAMNASGYADLAAKIPAGADWILADFIGTEPIDRPAWDLVQVPLRDWMKTAAGIPRRDPAALLALIEGLIMSGLAMQKAKSSRTASGAEHLFSHLWDNQHHEYNGIAPSHGFKVGIGTITTSALYDQILTLDSSVFDKALETLTDRFPDWNQIERKVRCSFTEPGLIDNALKQCRLKYVDQTECRRRLTLYREHWNELRKQLREQCMTAAGIQKLIAECGAPSRPEEIGIDRTRLRKSCELAQLIRCRYNILDWLLETGQWDEQINQLFIRGFWA